MEYFVPYELAVKLEQKGFKQGYNIFGFRPIFPDETTIRFISDIGAYEKEYFGENISAPTISQVLKWLREEKNIHITIDLLPSGYYAMIYIGISKKNNDFNWKDFYDDLNIYESYELAVLAGVEYCLDNLI
jgi:hypothetical protein